MLPYGRQTIDDADIAAVVEALRSPMLTCGPLVEQFEQALAAYTGARHVTACANGTAALHLAYAALGIGAGDEIITTPITFSATAAAAYYVGATVRVADVDARGNLSVASVEQLINSKTRAIVPVHLAGMPADLAELQQLARRHDLRVIEDACHALGATYRGEQIGGGDSDAVVFSFHPVKHITTGEGGAVAVRDARIKARMDRLRHHGISRTATGYDVAELGWNYRLPDLNCALGISQLKKLDGFVAKRRALVGWYREALAGFVDVPDEPTDRKSSYHLFAVGIDFTQKSRPQVQAELAELGVGTQVHYIPLLQHSLHAARCPSEVSRPRPGADRYYARTLSLPLYPSLTQQDVQFVVGALHRVLGETR